MKNGPCWYAAVVGVLVLNASAVFSSYLALDAGFGVTDRAVQRSARLCEF